MWGSTYVIFFNLEVKKPDAQPLIPIFDDINKWLEKVELMEDLDLKIFV